MELFSKFAIKLIIYLDFIDNTMFFNEPKLFIKQKKPGN